MRRSTLVPAGVLVFAGTLALTGCATDDPRAAPLAGDPISATRPEPTTTDVAPSTTVGTDPATGWFPISDPFEPDNAAVTVLDPGTGGVASLAYSAEGSRAFLLVIRVTSSETQVPRTTTLSGITVPADDRPGAGLWIEVDEVTSDEPDVGSFADPLGLLVDPTGAVAVMGPPDREWTDRQGSAIGALVRAVLPPLPATNVAPGARWGAPQTGPFPASRAAEYELLEVAGPLLTIAFSGESVAVPSGRRTRTIRGAAHTGTVTVDTSSGRVMGVVNRDGTIDVPDGAPPILTQAMVEIDSPIPGGAVLGAPVDTVLSFSWDWGADSRGTWDVTLDGHVGPAPDPRSSVPRFVGTVTVQSDGPDGPRRQSQEFRAAERTDWYAGEYAAAADAFFASALPAWITDRPVPAGEAVTFDDAFLLPDVGIGGELVDVTWTLEEVRGSTVVVSLDAPIRRDGDLRGAAFLIDGHVSARFEIDRFNPFDIIGSAEATFDTTLGNDPPTTVGQVWRAGPTTPG